MYTYLCTCVHLWYDLCFKFYKIWASTTLPYVNSYVSVVSSWLCFCIVDIIYSGASEFCCMSWWCHGWSTLTFISFPPNTQLHCWWPHSKRVGQPWSVWVVVACSLIAWHHYHNLFYDHHPDPPNPLPSHHHSIIIIIILLLPCHQAFTDYQLQQMTSNFIDQFGFNEDEFAEPEERVE